MSVLKLLDACFDQAEDVSPKRINIRFGCNGLRLLPLWFFALYRLGFDAKLCAFDPVSAVPLPGRRFQDVLEPDTVLVELALRSTHHCSSCSQALLVPALPQPRRTDMLQRGRSLGLKLRA